MVQSLLSISPKICKIVVICALSFYTILPAQESEVILQEISVKDGDTLWSVANYYLKDPRAWSDILKYNKLPSSDPNIILPGMKLKIPIMLVKESLRPAYLIYLLNDVRYRRRNTVTWEPAILNMEFFNEDGIRTTGNSNARVKFLTGELVHIGENSFVILRPEKEREEVKLFSGSVRSSKAKVLTERVTLEPKIAPSGAKPDYKTKVKEDKTTLVEVYEGIVDVTAEGKTVTLNKGFGTQVKFLQPPEAPRELPPLPKYADQSGGELPESKLETPEMSRGSLLVQMKLPEIPKLETKAKVVGALASKYHLQISSDNKFKEILIEETDGIKDRILLNFDKYNLPDGKYWYRLAYMDELGFESEFTLPRSFIIDKKPPVLEIIQPNNNERITDLFISVEGKTEPLATVSVNGVPVRLDETGKFSVSITGNLGENTLAIISKDKAGNITNIKRTVHCLKASQYKGKLRKDGTEKPSWASTPAGIAAAVATFIVILGVLVLVFH